MLYYKLLSERRSDLIIYTSSWHVCFQPEFSSLSSSKMKTTVFFVSVTFSQCPPGHLVLSKKLFTVKIHGFNGSISSRHTKNEQLTKIQTWKSTRAMLWVLKASTFKILPSKDNWNQIKDTFRNGDFCTPFTEGRN